MTIILKPRRKESWLGYQLYEIDVPRLYAVTSTSRRSRPTRTNQKRPAEKEDETTRWFQPQHSSSLYKDGLATDHG